MRITLRLVVMMAGLSMLAMGCAGPERKLGRGLSNVTEFARFGQMGYEMEQATMVDNFGYATGFVKGLNRSLCRTAVGAYEVVTFPIPDKQSYDPILTPEAPVFPDSYKPNRMADTFFSPDVNLGFGGGDVFPFSPGSRFHVFDN